MIIIFDHHGFHAPLYNFKEHACSLPPIRGVEFDDFLGYIISLSILYYKLRSINVLIIVKSTGGEFDLTIILCDSS